MKTIQKHSFSQVIQNHTKTFIYSSDKMSSKSHNEAEVQSLQGEGGSDVFTTTRHINNPNQQQQVSRKWKWMLDFFKIIKGTTFCIS